MNEIQTLKFGSHAAPVAPLSGSYNLLFEGESRTIDFDRTASEIQGSLESMSAIGTGNILVQSVINGFTFEFRGDLANTDVPLITADSFLFQAATSNPVLTSTQTGIQDAGNTPTINHIFNDGTESTAAEQVITFSPVPTQGQWTLDGNTVDWNQTPSISGWNASGSAQSGTVTLTYQSFGSGISQLSYSNSTLTQVVPGQPQIYTLAPSSDATAGQIELTVDSFYGIPTVQFANNVTTSNLQTAIGSNFTASGSDGGPWTLTQNTNWGVISASATSYATDPLRKPLGIEILETQAGGAPPVAAFSGTPTSGTSPLSVAFTDESTNTPTSWLWEKSDDAGASWSNFSSGATSQNPTEEFSSGVWAVRLTATNAGGSDSETKTDYITVTSAALPCIFAKGSQCEFKPLNSDLECIYDNGNGCLKSASRHK